MNQKIINLTQHKATPEQIEAGVFDFSEEVRKELSELLTFEEIPTLQEMIDRANKITELVYLYCIVHPKQAMIGGASFFMPYLVKELKSAYITPQYAFSKRVSEDQHQPDGTVKKIQVFKHIGFVPAV